MRVLLVDDDAVFRATLRRLLTEGGRHVDVEEAVNGEEGLRKIDRWRPDVVLMDITMPRMNGIEATRHLKRRWRDLPVLILSGHDDSVYERTARAAGADGFLLKKMAGAILWPVLAGLLSTDRRAGPERTLYAGRPPVTAPRGQASEADSGKLPRRVRASTRFAQALAAAIGGVRNTRPPLVPA